MEDDDRQTLLDHIEHLDRQFYTIVILISLFVIVLTTICILAYAWYSYYTRIRRDFVGKTCCVVGAAKGIGSGVAVTLAKRGAAKLILVDMHPCEDTKSKCVRAGCANVVTIQCDVSEKAKLNEDLDAKLSSSEFVSLVVDCAGVVSGKQFQDLSLEEFERVVNVNLIANFGLLKRFLPPMLERNQGCFVGISSLMGLMGGARLTDYCASKFGLVGMFEALRMEFGQSHPNVSFVTVCPYAVDTGMFEGIFEATWRTRLVRSVFPLLKTMDVAESIVLAAERGSSVAVLPFIFGPLINIARCLPSPLYEFVLTMMGGREGMNKFNGKSSVWGPKEQAAASPAAAEGNAIAIGKTQNSEMEPSSAEPEVAEVATQELDGTSTAHEKKQHQQASYDSLREFAGSISSLPSSDALNENPGTVSPTSAPLLQTVDENGSLPDNYDALVRSLEPASSPEAGSQDDWSDVKE